MEEALESSTYQIIDRQIMKNWKRGHAKNNTVALGICYQIGVCVVELVKNQPMMVLMRVASLK